MRPHLPTLSLLAALILLPACAAPAADSPTPASVSAEVGATQAMEVIALQHAVASELLPILEDLIGTGADAQLRVMADARTNALIVLGEAELRAKLRALVTVLDAPPER